MGPKVEAACRFAELGDRSVITTLHKLASALHGATGTIVEPSQQRNAPGARLGADRMPHRPGSTSRLAVQATQPRPGRAPRGRASPTTITSASIVITAPFTARIERLS